MSSISELLSQTGLVGRAVILSLILISFFSWSIIFAKWMKVRRATMANENFLDDFWKAKSIEEVFTRIEDYEPSTIARVFHSGFKELRKTTAHQTPLDHTVGNIERSLSRASQTEVAVLESGLGWLATTASVSPFVGLFGTVWGIMNAFSKIGSTGNANLATVAPGISEALITTALGIGAAIPAVVAYNYYLGRIKGVATDTDGFIQDFLNIIIRSGHDAAQSS